MTCWLKLGFAFLLYLVVTPTFAKNILITDIVKTAQHDWQVTYRSKTPISSLQFAISPDDSRLSRWNLQSEGFEFRRTGGKDTVFRRDGKSFNQVTFSLTANYIHLPKYYAPFAPFSDGSILVHSARFFACPQLCSGRENLWYLTLSAPESDTIILNGQLATKKVSWYDHNDGRKVFVGKIKPQTFNEFIAVIDPKIPENIAQPLHQFLPQAIDYLANKFAPLTTKPMLYASFGATNGEHYGRQGGVLPNQIFMHWYGKINENEPYELLWFFAHEAAHIFQGVQGINIASADAWIHEGHAEFIASELLSHFFPQAQDYVDQRLLDAKSQCQAKLTEMSLSQFANNGQYKPLYQCGLYFYHLLAKEAPVAEQMPFTFWRELTINSQTKPINLDSVKKAVIQISSKQSYYRIAQQFAWQ